MHFLSLLTCEQVFMGKKKIELHLNITCLKLYCSWYFVICQTSKMNVVFSRWLSLYPVFFSYIIRLINFAGWNSVYSWVTELRNVCGSTNVRIFMRKLSHRYRIHRFYYLSCCFRSDVFIAHRTTVEVFCVLILLSCITLQCLSVISLE